MTVIDTLGAGDNKTLQLSNFYAYQDRVTGEIVVDVTRFTARRLGRAIATPTVSTSPPSPPAWGC